MAEGYIRGVALGEGTWGHVYEATRKIDNLKVAIKRIKPMDPHLGINFTALREIKCLQTIKDDYVVDLKEVFFSGGVLHLVLEFCPFDLEKVIRDKKTALKAEDIKCYVQMILKGIEACHNHFILHRDLKPANLLITASGVIKLADFGLARTHGSPEELTSEVVTRWYRAPELLFGAPLYSGAVDMWAVGCIFAEIIFRVPMFPGNSDVEQLAKIFNVLGTPTDANWPEVNRLPAYIEFEAREPMNLIPLFGSSSLSPLTNGLPAALDLMLHMLTLNPLKRITASHALKHSYFTLDPLPCAPKDLQMPGTDLAVSSNMNGGNQLHTATSVVSFQLDHLDGLGGQPDSKRKKLL